MRKKIIILMVFSVLFTFFSFSFLDSSVVLANEERNVSDEELLGLYERLDYILHVDDGFLINDTMRGIGWGIVTLLKWFNNFIEDSVHKIITLNDFYASPAMANLMKVIKPLVFGLFVIALFVLGFQFMMNKIEKRDEVLLNVLMAVAVVVIIPVLMSSMNDVLKHGLSHTKEESGTLAGEMIKSNVADLDYYVEKNFVTDQSRDNKYYGNSSTPPTPVNKDNPSVGTTDFTNGNKLSAEHPNIAIIEKLDVQAEEGWFKWSKSDWYNGLSDKQKEFLTHQRVPSGYGDDYRVIKLMKNQIPATSLGQQAYYRWHVNWGVLIFSLLVTSVTLAITIVKIGRAIFDLAFHQIFGMFVAVTDLTGGQRTKKVLVEIANTFGVIFIMVFILQIFMLYSRWVNGLKPEIGAIPVVLLLIAGAWAVIDAPDIVQRLMGIDAGLRSGWQAMVGAYAGTKVAGGLAKGAGKLATGVATKGVAGANFGRRMMQGMRGKNSSGSSGDGSGNIPYKQIPNSHSGDTGQRGRPMQGDRSFALQNQQEISPSIEQGGYEGDSRVYPMSEDSIHSQPQTGSGGSHNERTGSRTTQNAQRQESIPSRKGKRNQMNVPSGHVQTPSGIIVPSSIQGSGSSKNTVSSQRESDSLAYRGTTSVGTDHVTSGLDRHIPSRQADPSIGGGTEHGGTHNVRQNSGFGMKETTYSPTWFGGSGFGHSFRDEVTRAGNSGFAIGHNIRRTGQRVATGVGGIAKGLGNTAMTTTRVVAHPKKAMDHLGRKAYVNTSRVLQTGVDKTKDIGQKSVATVRKGVEGTKNITNQIKTPLGADKPISKSRDIKKE